MTKSYFHTNCNILLTYINSHLLLANSHVKQQCPFCGNKYNKMYKKGNFVILELDKHLFETHYYIDITLYKKICESDENLNWQLIKTNDFNMIDGLFEAGSNKIFIDKNKNFFNSKINRYSESFGHLFFSNNKLDNIMVINKMRIDNTDPTIFLPKESLESLKVDFIFHTHPKTPYIGSRIKSEMIYEFPSISDIGHFIDHHNNGKLLCSLVIAPEGLYVIRKNIFNRDKLKIDVDILVDKLDDVYMECYKESMDKYFIELQPEKKLGEYFVNETIFHSKVAINYTFITKINDVLVDYDLFIDYYPRINHHATNYKNIDTRDNWIFPDIYIPSI